MSRYDGLIIPRSYSEYINKTDAATLQQALQLSGVLSGAVAAGDNKAVTSNAVNGALAEYGNKVDFQKSSVIAFNGTNPNSDINYEIGSVIPFINNLGSDMPASYWYEGIYGKCNGQNIGGLQNLKGVIKAGSIFYAQLVKKNTFYYFDVVTDKLVNQIATKSDLANYVMKESSPTFQDVKIKGTLNLNTTHTDDYVWVSNKENKVYFLVVWNNTTSCGYLVNKETFNKITLKKLFGDAYVSTNNYNIWFNVEPGTPNPCDYIMF